MTEEAIASPAAIDPSDPYEREAQTFPKLKHQQIERAKKFGDVEDLPKGTIVFERGDKTVDFFIVLEGSIEIYEPGPDGPNVFTVHGPSQFTGEIDLFNDRDILVGGRMGEDGRVIRINRNQFRRLLAAEPDIGETVMRAFILRRTGLITHRQGGVMVIGSLRSADGLRINRFLGRNGYPVRALEAADPEAAAVLEEFKLTEGDFPAVICGPDRILKNPTNSDLAQCLGLSETLNPDLVYDLIVVGAGPSGLAAAVYGASEGLKTLVLEVEAPGGQAGTSSRIENYLGFPTGISGQALAGRAQIQAQKFGATIALPRRAERLRCDERPYALDLDDRTQVRAKAVVIATGARYGKLNLENVEKFEGNGIHYAATALEAGLCGNEEVVIVGGGNSAGQAAMFLSRHASHVHILVRSDGLAASMSGYLIDRIDEAQKQKRITLHTRTQITALIGDRHLEQVEWTDSREGRSERRRIANVFLMLGARPNTEWLRDCLELDEKGFVRCGALVSEARWPDGRAPHIFEASRPGVFAVGDVRADSVKRVASAVGEGSIVVSAVHKVLTG